jgi:hypothetical protein
MNTFPRVFRLRQTFDAVHVDDVAGEVHAQLAPLDLGRKVRPGESVAITAGSRGIANIATITRAVAEYLKGLGAKPFVVPAMGSHGGGTADGQRRVLEGYGLTEATVGCPIRSSIETVVIGRAGDCPRFGAGEAGCGKGDSHLLCEAPEGPFRQKVAVTFSAGCERLPGSFPLHFDRLAFEADHVVVCNRVKPHTVFAGPIQSGLLKMLTIGLGNPAGAAVYHRAILDFGFDRVVGSAAAEVLARCHIVAGVAIAENAYDQTARIEAVPPKQFEAREQELLVLAKRWLPRLPFSHVDVLLIDRIGKEISGTGLDPNVVGRKFDDHKAVEGEFPKVKRIAVRGLTPASRGNAIGLGMAEFCRSQILDEVDVAATRLNGLTSGHISAVMTPLDYPTDREMLAAALGTIGLADPPDAKFLWISDTLHLGELECSAAYLAEARQRPDLEILSEPRELPFDASGNLLRLWDF